MDRPESDATSGLGDVLVERVLAHHGVKGMKWGRRKARPSHPASEDHTRASAASVKAKEGGVKALSNKELQDIIQRKQLEKQHRELTGGGSKFEKGHKHIKKILGVAKTFNDINTTVENTSSVVKKVASATR